jgi:predicted RNA-binding protein with RPS1 domain
MRDSYKAKGRPDEDPLRELPHSSLRMLHMLRCAQLLIVLSLRPASGAALIAPAPTFLSDLKPGDALKGRVLAHHKRKLFLSVPVQRRAKGGVLKDVAAYTDLPATHALLNNPEASIGKTLTVYVRDVQAASARLSVRLEPPQPPQPLATTREAACADARRLEDLEVGEPLMAVVRSVHPFGAFVTCNVTRAGRGGSRVLIDALLPAEHQPATIDDGRGGALRTGQRLELKVLQPSPGSGRLTVTAQPLGRDALLDLIARRRARRQRNDRRPSLASLAVGSEREGTVVDAKPYGLIVNVGARKNGLLHVSQLGRGFVGDPTDVCPVGARVMVKVMPRSGPRRLLLRLVRIFPPEEASESDLAVEIATLRRGESLRPRFERADDDAEASSLVEAAAVAAVAADVEAAWTAREAEDGEKVSVEEDKKEADRGGDGDEEDPWAWAASASNLSVQAEVRGGEEEDDDEVEEDEELSILDDAYFDDFD